MAYAFNGTSHYLSTASAPASGTPMTLALWVRRSSTATNQSVLSVGDNAGTHRNQINLRSGSSPAFAVEAIAIGVTTTSRAVTSSATTINQWDHACCVYNSATSRFAYLNGSASAEDTTDVGSQNAATGLQVATRIASNATANFTQGEMAEVGIWNAALTAAEVASLADGMTCDKVRPQSLVFYAPLVRNLQDVRGGLTITNNNTATVANHPRVYA